MGFGTGFSRRTRRDALALVAFVALSQSSCSDGVTSPSELIGGVWRLQEMRPAGEARFVPDDPSRFTVEFGADGRVGIVADCNQCGGGYVLRGETLVVSSLACTLALCAAPGGEQFTRLLDGTTTVDGDGARIQIESARGALVLVR